MAIKICESEVIVNGKVIGVSTGYKVKKAIEQTATGTKVYVEVDK